MSIVGPVSIFSNNLCKHQEKYRSLTFLKTSAEKATTTRQRIGTRKRGGSRITNEFYLLKWFCRLKWIVELTPAENLSADTPKFPKAGWPLNIICTQPMITMSPSRLTRLLGSATNLYPDFGSFSLCTDWSAQGSSYPITARASLRSMSSWSDPQKRNPSEQIL